VTHLFEPHTKSVSSSSLLLHAMPMWTFTVFRGTVVHHVSIEVLHREKVVACGTQSAQRKVLQAPRRRRGSKRGDGVEHVEVLDVPSTLAESCASFQGVVIGLASCGVLATME